jgi:predicted dehydrogenase
MKVLEAHELISAISEGKPYACDFEFGWKIDRTVSAILKSAAEKKWVEVGEQAVEVI